MQICHFRLECVPPPDVMQSTIGPGGTSCPWIWNCLRRWSEMIYSNEEGLKLAKGSLSLETRSSQINHFNVSTPFGKERGPIRRPWNRSIGSLVAMMHNLAIALLEEEETREQVLASGDLWETSERLKSGLGASGDRFGTFIVISLFLS